MGDNLRHLIFGDFCRFLLNREERGIIDVAKISYKRYCVYSCLIICSSTFAFVFVVVVVVVAV